MRQGFETLNGQPFQVRRWGDAGLPRLLMLHGFPEYGGAWAELAEKLSAQYHCIAPDQRGYGQSWAPEGTENYRISALVSDMAALIGDEPVIVLGHDWGASVAYALAISRPDLVERLIIMNGVHPVPFQTAMAAGGAQTEASQYIHFLRREGSEDILAAEGFARLQALFSAKMDMSWMQGDVLEGYIRAWGDTARLGAMINWYRASTLQVGEVGKPLEGLPEFPVDKLCIGCPHLLIWGVDDTALLPEATKGLENFAPDLTRVEIAGADHWLHHQKPDEVARVILDWLPSA